MDKQIAIYTRVSSKAQDTRSQLTELKAYAARAILPVHWYSDKSTGTTMDRHGFNQLMDAVRQGKVDTIAVWRLDRLGRTCLGLVKLFDELREAKVNLVSLKDSLDMSTPAGRLMANVLASVASFESEVRQERQSAGIAAAKASGKTWGGRKEGENWKVKPDQIAVAKGLKADGKGIALIARTLNLSRPTIYRILAS